MTRAEIAALGAYPDDRFVDAEYSFMCRGFYQEGYEQAKKDTIERACEYLFRYYAINIGEFKKAMEEEQWTN